VDQPYLGEPFLDRHLEICIYDVGHIAWWEGMEVDAVLDWNFDRILEVDDLVVLLLGAEPVAGVSLRGLP